MTRRTERRERLARATQRMQRPVMPGVAPETPRTVLQAEASAPMRGGIEDLQHAGLFGDAHKQQEMF